VPEDRFENEDVPLLPDLELEFMIASNEVPANRRMDFDATVSAMALTAKEMNSKYETTSEGGLAVSVVLC
jgi:L-serine dehydratase